MLVKLFKVIIILICVVLWLFSMVVICSCLEYLFWLSIDCLLRENGVKIIFNFINIMCLVDLIFLKMWLSKKKIIIKEIFVGEEIVFNGSVGFS